MWLGVQDQTPFLTSRSVETQTPRGWKLCSAEPPSTVVVIRRSPPSWESLSLVQFLIIIRKGYVRHFVSHDKHSKTGGWSKSQEGFCYVNFTITHLWLNRRHSTVLILVLVCEAATFVLRYGWHFVPSITVHQRNKQCSSTPPLVLWLSPAPPVAPRHSSAPSVALGCLINHPQHLQPCLYITLHPGTCTWANQRTDGHISTTLSSEVYSGTLTTGLLTRVPVIPNILVSAWYDFSNAAVTP